MVKNGHGVGLILPTTVVLCLQRAPHAAGSTSALLGTVQYLMGSLAPALTGLGDQSTARPMAATIIGLALVATASFVALCRPWRPAPDPLTY
jgi:DHA1 family bicyclomycin/chloramphenicol resistance-like MFS transporter